MIVARCVHLAQYYLEAAGAEVVTAENGLKALEVLAQSESAERFVDVVLMDMQMPVMDGYEATIGLRAKGFTRPIIAVTAHAMQGDNEHCLCAGPAMTTTKPIDGAGHPTNRTSCGSSNSAQGSIYSARGANRQAGGTQSNSGKWQDANECEVN